MPIYEYTCDACHETFEVIQRLSDGPLQTHAGCGGAVTKLMSAPRTKVKENDGLSGSTHFSILKAHENRQIAADKKKQSRARVVSLPSAGTAPGKTSSED